MSGFSMFKKISPALLLTAYPGVFAYSYDSHECLSSDKQFAIKYKFENVTLKPGNLVFFDLIKSDGTEYWGGSGALMGMGNVTQTECNLELSFTATGSSDEKKLGILQGKKTSSGWRFQMIPYRNNKPVEGVKIPLNCRNYEQR